MLILPVEVALLELTSRILLCDCVREALISRTVSSAITFQPAVDTWTGLSDNVYVTNSLHSMGQSPSWEAPQLVGKFLAFYETRRFITEFKHRSPFPILTQKNPAQTLPFHAFKAHVHTQLLHFSLPRCHLSSGIPTKALHALFSSPMHAAFPAHLMLFD